VPLPCGGDGTDLIEGAQVGGAAWSSMIVKLLEDSVGTELRAAGFLALVRALMLRRVKGKMSQIGRYAPLNSQWRENDQLRLNPKALPLDLECEITTAKNGGWRP
jgi:hypothetical protein